MSCYEFEVVPAPIRPRKLTDLTKGQDVYCATITDILTDMGLAGWEFVGAETLPHYQRRMLFFSRYVEQTCLVFRREIERLVEPKRVDRPRAEVTEVLAAEPERQARPEVVAQFNSGARKLSVPVTAGARTAEDVPARAAPLKLEDPIHESPVVPMKRRNSDDPRGGLSALERAVAIQPDT